MKMEKNNLIPVIMVLLIAIVCGYAGYQEHIKSKPDRFYLPQADQPFEGKVDTRIYKSLSVS